MIEKIKIYKVYFFLVLCVLFWSGNFILGRFIKDEISPIELAFFRWIFALIFIFPFSLKYMNLKKCIKITKDHFFILSILAILGITLFNTIVYIALQTTQATNALLINSTTPLIVLFLSFLILGNKIKKIQILGFLLSTFGVVFIILEADFTQLSNYTFKHGDIWIIVSATVWALYSIFLRFKPKELNHVELFTTIVILGIIYLIPIYLYQGYSIKEEFKVFYNNWQIIFYVSFFASVLSFYFWNYGVSQIGPEKCSQFAHLMPLFGAILAYFFLNETIELYHLIGACFIGVGIYLSLFLAKH
ncbi:EamA family transporter [Malaciobacter molluscorum LMG 25693]|uniref:EamA family transporter n=1 Tax=Malaciobacter molluscorum LMG 25693 TaxID=870501 RepID=A0A2G1DGK9_9BACT|nr:DMT family transporter [Malaciobacter molluscorum]AXX92494.1 EamA/RhaT family transporter [Malaciobacter molluscorum LMG 25693]PHO17635.1 EamA family transporter [Malaciobacter molluscorum LMG 25693]